jgi:type I restriction enzyme, S subunit
MDQDERMALPDGWRWVKLGDVCEIIMGQSPPSETYINLPVGLPFFQGKADFGKRYPTPRVWCNQPIKIAEKNDILISVRAPVGSSNLSNCKCCIGRGLAAIRSIGKTDTDFIFLFLKLNEHTLASLGNGSTFTSISRKDLDTFLIPLPPLPEQKRITAILNEKLEAVERARQAAKEQLEAIDRLPSVLLSRAFRGEL